MKLLQTILISFLIILTTTIKAQYSVHAEDVVHFWEAFDSVQTTTDKAQQIAIIQRLYVDRGSEGLKEFMKLRGGNAEKWQAMIAKDKKELERIRPYTLSVLEQKPIIDKHLAQFKELYSDFKAGDIFFTIGIHNSGGTTEGSHVLIGCEVAANEKPDWAVALVAHEFVHTQQKFEGRFHLLKHTLVEGAADFVSETVTGLKLATLNPNGHTAFGLQNEQAVWEAFKKVMFATDDDTFGWLYGSPGVTLKGVNKIDLGYYMGYRICKSYYDKATDKKQALKEIIELKYDDEAARQFVLASGYVPQKDIDFVKNTPFYSIEEKDKKIKKSIYGYKIKKGNVIFEYPVPKEMDLNYIKTVSVAGSFNSWNPKAEGFQMQKTGNRKYTLSIPLAQFDKKQAHSFKFVLNGGEWQSAPKTASNIEKEGYGNLLIELK